MIAAEKGWDPAMMAYNRPRVAAVILNYNTGDDCRKCLHYLHSQEDADVWIVVVDNGSIIECGTPQELMEQGGLYRHMVELQSETAEWRFRKAL